MRTSKRFLAMCIAFFALTSTTFGEEHVQPFRYVSGEKFLSWPEVSRIDYVTGIVDALSYLTETTGTQRGISDCFKKSDPKAAFTKSQGVQTLKPVPSHPVDRAPQVATKSASVAPSNRYSHSDHILWVPISDGQVQT